jgi:hypothetical protein
MQGAIAHAGGAILPSGPPDLSAPPLPLAPNVLSSLPPPQLPHAVYGAAVGVFNGASATVDGCTFTGAQARNGGAIAVTSSGGVTTLAVTGSSFSGCKATVSGGGGGAIFLQGAGSGGAGPVTATLAGSSFDGNAATGATVSLGGAVVVGAEGDALTVDACTFTGNNAVYAAAIYAASLIKLTIRGSTFAANAATAAYGTTVQGFCADARISGSTFKGAFTGTTALSFYCDAPARPVAIDSCLFDSTPLPGEAPPPGAAGTRHVVLTGAGLTGTVTRSAFLNAAGGEGAAVAVGVSVKGGLLAWMDARFGPRPSSPSPHRRPQ